MRVTRKLIMAAFLGDCSSVALFSKRLLKRLLFYTLTTSILILLYLLFNSAKLKSSSNKESPVFASRNLFHPSTSGGPDGDLVSYYKDFLKYGEDHHSKSSHSAMSGLPDVRTGSFYSIFEDIGLVRNISDCMVVEVLCPNEMDKKIEHLNQLLTDVRREALAYIQQHLKARDDPSNDVMDYYNNNNNNKNVSKSRTRMNLHSFLTAVTIEVDRLIDANTMEIFTKLPNLRTLRLKFVEQTGKAEDQSRCLSSNFSRIPQYRMSMTNETCARKYLNNTSRVALCRKQYTNISASLLPDFNRNQAYFGRLQPHILVTFDPDAVFIDGKFGSVFTKGHIFLPSQCGMDTFSDYAKNHLDKKISLKGLKFYREVFVTAMYWGEGFFHNTVENMPRIAFFIDFLSAHTDIRIHISLSSRTPDLLQLYGLDPIRIIFGDVCAEVVYLPRGGGCGVGCPSCVQHMSRYFKLNAFQTKLHKIPILKTDQGQNKNVTIQDGQDRESDMNKIPVLRTDQDKNITSVNGEGKNLNVLKSKQPEEISVMHRANVVLIKRNRRRYLINHNSVQKLLFSFCSDFNLTCILYGDNPVPSMEATREIFGNAVIVVAPHGAGLSNVIFSQAGTYVVEVLPRESPVNFCYQALCYNLGHHWHGIVSLTSQPKMKVELNELKTVLKVFLEDIFHKER